MKLKTLIGYSLAVVLTACLLTACATEKEKTAKLEAKAKITQAEAQKTALAQVPGGTVKDCEIEDENGKLVWSFDVATPGSPDITEVLVNAMDGSVVSVEKETPAQQAKEKAEDAKAKKGKNGEKDEDDQKDEKK